MYSRNTVCLYFVFLDVVYEFYVPMGSDNVVLSLLLVFRCTTSFQFFRPLQVYLKTMPSQLFYVKRNGTQKEFMHAD